MVEFIRIENSKHH